MRALPGLVRCPHVLQCLCVAAADVHVTGLLYWNGILPGVKDWSAAQFHHLNEITLECLRKYATDKGWGDETSVLFSVGSDVGTVLFMGAVMLRCCTMPAVCERVSEPSLTGSSHQRPQCGRFGAVLCAPGAGVAGSVGLGRPVEVLRHRSSARPAAVPVSPETSWAAASGHAIPPPGGHSTPASALMVIVSPSAKVIRRLLHRSC